MRRHLICLVLLSLTFSAAECQHFVRGRVTDANTKKPIPGVSVYINNSFIGVYSNDSGEFVIKDLPAAGTFKLIFSHIGYETIVESINAKELKDKYLVALSISHDELKEVVVTSKTKNGWHKWGNFFFESFIGTSRYADNCTIINKDKLHFYFSQADNQLTVTAREPIIIENRSLGYKLTIDLIVYNYNFSNRYLYYEIYSKYDYLQADDAIEARKWRNNRKEVYYGSLMHFFRSLFDSSFEKEGFEVRKFGKPFNKEVERIKDSLKSNTDLLKAITATPDNKNNNSSKTLPNADTINYYKNVLLKYSSSDELSPELLKFKQFAARSDSNIVLLDFDQYLHITYTKKKEPLEYNIATGKYRPGQQMIRGKLNSQTSYEPDDQHSTLQLVNNTPVQVFYNGNFNNTDLLVDGYWGWWQKVATMLPYEYTPR